jgi:hypothetical protein
MENGKLYGEQLSTDRDEILVPVRKLLRDGKPGVYKLEQLRWLDFAALARGLPRFGPPREGEPEGEAADREKLAEMMPIVCRAIVGVRRAVRKSPDGPWVDGGMVEVRVVKEPRPDAVPREIQESDIDQDDNVSRMFNALLGRIEYGGEVPSGAKFRSDGNGGDRSAGGEVREVAARDRHRPKRRAGSKDPARAS